MKLALWLATQAAAIVIVTVYLNQYLADKWAKHVKELRMETMYANEQAQHLDSENVRLKQRVKLMRAEMMEGGNDE